MIILVTGGTGFVGSHLCKELLKNGNNVVCIDNNYTGSLQNISDIIDNPNFKFIEHDIIFPLDIKFEKIDQIYHLACPASPKAYQRDPIFTIKTSTIGTINILELARKYKSKILFTSTSEIYGDPKVHPQVETYWGNVNTIGVRSCYDEGKRISETIMIEYQRKYNIDIKIARLFNTYGPNMDKDDGRVVSNFINQCLDNIDITIYGDGSQTRSFCFVSDTVQGIICLMNSNYNLPVNIGNPNEISVKELSKIILSMIPSSLSKIIFMDLPSDDPCVRKPDITIANNVLNWYPKVDLSNGLTKTIEYFLLATNKEITHF